MVSFVDEINDCDAKQVILEKMVLLRPMPIHRAAHLVFDLHKSDLAANAALIQQERTWRR